jgi:amine acid ABC transporter, permease protein, 3-TM region, His/Glu/Gln/Arg/opine family
MSIDLIYIIEILPALLKAMLVTLRIAISGYLLAFILGLLIAMIRVSGNVFLSRLLLMFTEFIRLTPILVQLFFFYYVLPEVGIKITTEPTGIIVLGLHNFTFPAEVFRSGF